ncbi:MAG: HAD-IA family hydrolase [Veillonellales bacterium]
MYKHVVWDFDGTLYNTYPGITKAFFRVVTEENIKIDIKELGAQLRVSIGNTQKRLNKQYGLSDDFEKKYLTYRNQIEEECIPTFPYAIEICRAIWKSGKKNYLYTHRDTTALKHLEKSGIRECFADCISIEDDFPRKPDPAALLSLAKRHNFSPAECIMIGDRDIDILAGKNAGMAACFFAENKTTVTASDYNIYCLEQLYNILKINK